MANKPDYSIRIRQASSDFANYEQTAEDLARIFVSRGYEPGGDNELTQADLDAAGIEIAIADVQAFVLMFQDMETWIDAGGRREVLDRLRLAASI